MRLDSSALIIMIICLWGVWKASLYIFTSPTPARFIIILFLSLLSALGENYDKELEMMKSAPRIISGVAPRRDWKNCTSQRSVYALVWFLNRRPAGGREGCQMPWELFSHLAKWIRQREDLQQRHFKIVH